MKQYRRRRARRVPRDPELHQWANEAERRRRWGDHACCLIVGCDASVLTLSETRYSLGELHHVFGRVHDGQTVLLLCPTHHRMAQLAMERDGVDLRRQRSFLEALLHMLRSLGTLFELLVQWARRSAESLAQFIARLDEKHARWRTTTRAR